MKNTTGVFSWYVGIVLIGAILIFGIQGIFIAIYKNSNSSLENINVGINASERELYLEECGACHLAYPPGLLPAKSWNKIMVGLEDHFDDNAELDKETTGSIASYLGRYSLVKGKPSTTSRLLRNLGEKSPIRITQIPQFESDHREARITLQSVSNEKPILSQCEDCHVEAQSSIFKNPQLPLPTKT